MRVAGDGGMLFGRIIPRRNFWTSSLHLLIHSRITAGCPVYTPRPVEYNGWKVNYILLSGYESEIMSGSCNRPVERNPTFASRSGWTVVLTMSEKAKASSYLLYGASLFVL